MKAFNKIWVVAMAILACLSLSSCQEEEDKSIFTPPYDPELIGIWRQTVWIPIEGRIVSVIELELSSSGTYTQNIYTENNKKQISSKWASKNSMLYLNKTEGIESFQYSLNNDTLFLTNSDDNAVYVRIDSTQLLENQETNK